MSYKTYNEAVADLTKRVGPATKGQKKLAKFLKINFPDGLPSLVVAAKIRDHLSAELALSSNPFVSDHTLKFIRSVQKDIDGKINPQSQAEGEGWINHLQLLRRLEHIEGLKIDACDIVEVKEEGKEEGYIAEVSSIGNDGRIYFKGGRGAGSWPDLLIVRAKSNDVTQAAEDLRKKAHNIAAKNSHIGLWSQAKQMELAYHCTHEHISEADINQLELVINLASDEKPIQKHLEEYPHILTSILGGNERYCIPQKRLGSEYVPDFLISDTDSLGINWVLIELETPNSSIYLKTTDQLDTYARKGVAQIQEWREWLEMNLAYARRKKTENGLGLVDIRPASRAIVIVGKRNLLRDTKEISRNQLRDRENIHIHTYDWLIAQLRGALAFVGPPGLNPHLIQREPHQ